MLIHVGVCVEKHWFCLYMSCFPSVHLDHQDKRGLVFFSRGMLYSDMAWSRSSDIYIGVFYLHMVFVFYFISPARWWWVLILSLQWWNIVFGKHMNISNFHNDVNYVSFQMRDRLYKKMKKNGNLDTKKIFMKIKHHIQTLYSLYRHKPVAQSHSYAVVFKTICQQSFTPF
jgi:hypothetical protein